MTGSGPPTGSGGPRTAGEVYTAALEPPAPGRARLVAAVRGVLLGVAAMIGWYDEPSAGDLVVRRLGDGRELLRVDAGPSEAAAGLLAHVRGQLESLTPRAFRERWGVLDPALGPQRRSAR